MKILARLLAIALTLCFAASASGDAERMDDPVDRARLESATSPRAWEMPPTAANVARAVITREVRDREPVDHLTSLETDQETIYFFTELRNLEGSIVTHRWELDGVLMAEVPFSVGSPRWRVWSSKQLRPEWRGNWVVSVIDTGGQVLASTSLGYSDQAGGAASPPAKVE